MQKTGNKLLSVLLALVLALGLLPAAALAAEEPHAHDGYTAWDSGTSLPATAGSFYLTKDVELPEESPTWTVPAGTVNLCLNGYGIKGYGIDYPGTDGSKNYPVIIVKSGATLNLYDCGTTTHTFSVSGGLATVGGAGDSFEGGYITGGFGGDNGGGVYINGNSTFNMYGGTILGNRATNGGAGVRVNQGTFNMYGGRVCYNTSNLAGGVRVKNSSTMALYDGKIDHNAATGGGSDAHKGHGGGILLDCGGVLNLNGGSIEANTASLLGDGVFVAGKTSKDAAGVLALSGDADSPASPEFSGNSVYLADGTRIRISGPVDQGVEIPVKTATKPSGDASLVITDGLSGYAASAVNFTSEDTGYRVLRKDGEAVLISSGTADAKVTVAADPAEGGTVLGGDVYVRNSTATVTATPNEGYEFVRWTKDGADVTETAESYEFTADGDISIVASFEKQSFTITWKDDNGETIDTATVEYGVVPTHEDPAKEADALHTYTFVGWKADDGNVYAPDKLPKATADAVYQATFSSADVLYKLTFVDYDCATELESSELLVGDPLSGYGGKTVTRENFTFAGWTTEPRIDCEFNYNETLPKDDPNRNDPDGEYAYVLFDFDSSVMPDQDLTLYPVFVRDRLEVHLVWEDDVTMPLGSDGKAQSPKFTVDLNETLRMEAMNEAQRPGYELLGWFTSGGVQWDGAWGVTPEYCDKDESGDPVRGEKPEKNYSYYIVTLTARWAPMPIPVYFDTEEDGAVSLGEILKLRSAPTKDGYIFDGWKDKNDGMHAAGEAFAFEDWSLAEDDKLTFTSVWEEKKTEADSTYTISFDTDGGSYIAAITAKAGDAIEKPADPTKSGYTFDGWSEEFPTAMPDHDMTLKAKWKAIQYKITFDTLGGSAVDPIEAESGASLTRPDDPEKDHYAFVDWHPAFPGTMPAKDLELTASWMPKEYTATFETGEGTFGDGEASITITGIYGSELKIPTPIAPEGYRFDGWDPEAPAYMPDDGPTFYAKYTKLESEDEPEPEPEPEPGAPRGGGIVPEPRDPGSGGKPGDQPAPGKRDNPFVDVGEKDYFNDAVTWAYENGITTGVDNTHFDPYGTASRGQMVTFLWRAAGSPAPKSAANPFSDISEGDFFYQAVLWAAEQGIAQGTGGGKFTPYAPVNRAQAAAFIYRYEQSRGGGFTGLWAFPLNYDDAADVPEYAYEAFCWLTMKGVINGADGKLMPLQPCLRGQIVTMLYRYFTV